MIILHNKLSNHQILYLKVPYACCHSVAKLCSILCKLMDYSMPGFPVLHCLLEFVQIHVHMLCANNISLKLEKITTCSDLGRKDTLL